MGKTIADAAASPAAGIYCRFCSYDLRGQETHRCPECGRGYDSADRKTFRRRPRRRWVRRVILSAVVLLLLLAAPFAWLYYDWHREQAAVRHFRDSGAEVELKRIDVPVLSKLVPGRYGWMLERVETIVDLRGTGSPDGVRLAASCRRVEVLALYGSAVTGTGVDAIADLPHLRVLHLWGRGIDDACAKRLGQRRSLERLALNNTSLTDAGLAHLCRLPALKGLRIGSPHLTSAGLDALVEVPKLEVLYLQGPGLTDDALIKLARFAGLKGLDVVEGRFTRAAVERLKAALPNCRVYVDPKPLLPAPPATGPATAP